MTPDTASAAGSRAQIVRELHELIAALERRVPHVERVGEISIARAASALKREALKRIEELEREAPVSSSPC
jgi:chorismate mutase